MYTNKEECLLGEYYKCASDLKIKQEEIEKLQKDIENLKNIKEELFKSMREYAYCTQNKEDKTKDEILDFFRKKQ